MFGCAVVEKKRVMGQDCYAGFIAVPWSILCIPTVNVVPAWSGSPMGCIGGGIFEGPGSLNCSSPPPIPPNPRGRCSFGLVKYALSAGFQVRLYQALLMYSIGSL